MPGIAGARVQAFRKQMLDVVHEKYKGTSGALVATGLSAKLDEMLAYVWQAAKKVGREERIKEEAEEKRATEEVNNDGAEEVRTDPTTSCEPGE